MVIRFRNNVHCHVVQWCDCLGIRIIIQVVRYFNMITCIFSHNYLFLITVGGPNTDQRKEKFWRNLVHRLLFLSCYPVYFAQFFQNQHFVTAAFTLPLKLIYRRIKLVLRLVTAFLMMIIVKFWHNFHNCM